MFDMQSSVLIKSTAIYWKYQFINSYECKVQIMTNSPRSICNQYLICSHIHTHTNTCKFSLNVSDQLASEKIPNKQQQNFTKNIYSKYQKRSANHSNNNKGTKNQESADGVDGLCWLCAMTCIAFPFKFMFFFFFFSF